MLGLFICLFIQCVYLIINESIRSLYSDLVPNKTHTQLLFSLPHSCFHLPQDFFTLIRERRPKMKVIQLCYIQNNTHTCFTLLKFWVKITSQILKAEHIINRSAYILISVDCEYCVFVNAELVMVTVDFLFWQYHYSFLPVFLFLSIYWRGEWEKKQLCGARSDVTHRSITITVLSKR